MNILKYVVAVSAALVAVILNFGAKKISNKIKGDERLLLSLKTAAAVLCILDFVYVLIYF